MKRLIALLLIICVSPAFAANRKKVPVKKKVTVQKKSDWLHSQNWNLQAKLIAAPTLKSKAKLVVSVEGGKPKSIIAQRGWGGVDIAAGDGHPYISRHAWVDGDNMVPIAHAIGSPNGSGTGFKIISQVSVLAPNHRFVPVPCRQLKSNDQNQIVDLDNFYPGGAQGWSNSVVAWKVSQSKSGQYNCRTYWAGGW